MRRLYGKYREWLVFSPMDDKSLAIFRIIYALFCLLSLNLYGRYDWIGYFPDFFYNPVPSLASLYSSFPSVFIFHAFNFILPLLALMLLIGYKTRIVSMIYGVSIITMLSFVFSITSTIYHLHLIPYTALIFSFSNWGNYYSVDAFLASKKGRILKKRHNVMPLFSLIIAFSFFTSGFIKLINGWLNVNYQAVRYYLVEQLINGHFENVVVRAIIEFNLPSFLWESLDYLVICLELVPLLFLFNRVLFKTAIFFIATFHVTVALLMDISFSFYPILYAPLIVDMHSSLGVKYLQELMNKLSEKCSIFRVIFFSILVYLIYLIIIYSPFFNVVKWSQYSPTFYVYFSYLILITFMIKSKTKNMNYY